MVPMVEVNFPRGIFFLKTFPYSEFYVKFKAPKMPGLFNNVNPTMM